MARIIGNPGAHASDHLSTWAGASRSPRMASSRPGCALGLGQPRGEDPHELRRCRRPHLGPRIREVVLDGRVRQAQSVSGRLLRPGHEDGDDDVYAGITEPVDGTVKATTVARRGPAGVEACGGVRVSLYGADLGSPGATQPCIEAPGTISGSAQAAIDWMPDHSTPHRGQPWKAVRLADGRALAASLAPCHSPPVPGRHGSGCAGLASQPESAPGGRTHGPQLAAHRSRVANAGPCPARAPRRRMRGQRNLRRARWVDSGSGGPNCHAGCHDARTVASGVD